MTGERRDRFTAHMFGEYWGEEVYLEETPEGLVELSVYAELAVYTGGDGGYSTIKLNPRKVRELRLTLVRLEKLLRTDPLPVPDKADGAPS